MTVRGDESAKMARIAFDPEADQEIVQFLSTLRKDRRRTSKIIHMIRLGIKENPDLLGDDFLVPRDPEQETYSVRIRLSESTKDLRERWQEIPWGDRGSQFAQYARIGFRVVKEGVSSHAKRTRPSASRPVVKQEAVGEEFKNEDTTNDVIEDAAAVEGQDILKRFQLSKENL